jgi:hypothetical protein
MHFEIIDNFLPAAVHQHLKHVIYGPDTKWECNGARGWAFDADNDMTVFYHYMVNHNELKSEHDQRILDCFSPLMERFGSPIVARAVWSQRRVKRVKSDYHMDKAEPHVVALYYMNDNNSYTEFKDGVRVYAKENRVVIFDGHTPHRATANTDDNERLIFNFNFNHAQ